MHTHSRQGFLPHAVLLTAIMLSIMPTSLDAADLPDGVKQVAPAELRIERDRIGESVAASPIPQGVVDVNPPWLHVEVPLPDRPKATRTRQE